ncbi:MAG: hypothetical protein ACLGIN_04525 [Candidatus Sericytochromatia bacterium]
MGIHGVSRGASWNVPFRWRTVYGKGPNFCSFGGGSGRRRLRAFPDHPGDAHPEQFEGSFELGNARCHHRAGSDADERLSERPRCDADADADRNGDRGLGWRLVRRGLDGRRNDRHAHPDPDPDPDPHTHTHPDPHTHPNPYTHPDPYSHPDSSADPNPHTRRFDARGWYLGLQ